MTQFQDIFRLGSKLIEASKFLGYTVKGKISWAKLQSLILAQNKIYL